MDNHACEWQILSGGVCRDESICQERAVSWNLSISSISDSMELTAVDRENVDRRLAYSLSRYSDRLISINLAIDLTTFPGGAEEYRCDLQGEIVGHRTIRVTTRGESLDETVARAGDRAARAVDRAILEISTV